MANSSLGQIITFYSYKGGTGRSMTLANVACILAERDDLTPGKGVLMMDWDLEAPGLHRYFCDRLEPRKRAADSRGTGSCDAEPGLIELFYELESRIDSLRRDTTEPEMLLGEETARNIFDAINLDKYLIPTTIGGLSLLKAGRFNPRDSNEYPEKVNKFSWEGLYNKSPHLMRVFAEVLSERYDYVLIDSRTGVTDISGVCTMLLPEKLVVVFTPNMQSLMGAVEVVSRATDYRKESDDLRSLVVFPLVSRVESNEPDLRHDWRFGNPDKNIIGYQAEFEKVLAEAYRKDDVKLDDYFDEMQIQHIPRYAYGEDIAVLEEKIDDKFSLRRSYRTFASKLVERGLPWEGLSVEEKSPSSQAVSKEVPLKLASLVRSVLTTNTSVLTALLFLIAGVLLAGIIIIGMFFAFRSAPRASSSLTDTPANTSSKSEIGKFGVLTTNLRIRSQPSKNGDSLGVHYQGAQVEILEEASSEDTDGMQMWYRIRVTQNGCDRESVLGCGNDLDGVVGKAAMEGWMNARYIVIEAGDLGTESSLNRTIKATVTSPDDGFLALKSEPCVAPCGTMLLKISHGTQLSIDTCKKDFEIADKKLGRWCNTSFNGQRGWVFDAFLTYEKPSSDEFANLETKLTPAGKWSGGILYPTGTAFSARAEFTDSGNGEIRGQILWTLLQSSNPDNKTKVGMSATEFVRGTYDRSTRTIRIKGYDKRDDANLISLDYYTLSISNDGQIIEGSSSPDKVVGKVILRPL